MGIFNFSSNKKHKHKWIRENRFNKEYHMIWSLRKCACGVVEIFMGGGTGDKTWRPFNGEFKFDWEKKWFEEAV